ncbi:MAG: acetolactate synthase [Planctomycetes bacterium]|nr:acetolactate synthase [Planctomycetota bacterium]
MRGRDWPCLRQFVVFLENRVGSLNDLLRHLEGHDLRVIALSIVDSVDCAIVRVMLDDYERGRSLFDLSPFPVFETDIIGVELPDDPQPYVRICRALLQAELNIHYTYPLLYRRRGRGAIALYVDDLDLGLKTLAEKGHRILTEKDLLDDDEFF